MRISDWSSDVCSSDLNSNSTLPSRKQESPKNGSARLSSRTAQDQSDGHPHPANQESGDWRRNRSTREDSHSPWARTDRKSVVKGKRVSVRVDIGGRRIIKKKKNKNANIIQGT